MKLAKQTRLPQIGIPLTTLTFYLSLVFFNHKTMGEKSFKLWFSLKIRVSDTIKHKAFGESYSYQNWTFKEVVWYMVHQFNYWINT